jgi:F-type H+-transporting ATPase subunit c
VSTRSLVTTALVFATLGFVSPAYAQEAAAHSGGGAAVSTLVQWSVITAGFALAIAAAFGALGQGKAVSAAVEAIARNPSAAGDIRANLLLGLVLIESLVIYVLLIALILLFLGPFGAPTVS